MKKLLFTILLLFACIITISSVKADDKIKVYFFRGYNCTHCESSLKYLHEHKDDIPKNVEIVTFEVWKNSNNRALQLKLAEKLNIPEDNEDSVPLIIVGNSYKIGMDGTPTDFNKLLTLIETGSKNYQDIVSPTIKELEKEDKDFKAKSLTLSELYPDNTILTIVVFAIFGAIILGFGGMILFSRKK